MSRPRSVYEEVNIKLLPLLEEIKIETLKGGVKSYKNISLDELIKSLENSRKTSVIIPTGFLPENCLSVTFDNNLKRLVIWHPLLRVDYTYFKTMYENFPLPRMVFEVTVDPDGKVLGCRMAVIEDGKPKPDTKIYEFPFSNVFPDSRICTGAANSMPVYKNLHTLASLPHHLLSIPNNDHMFNVSRNRLGLEYRELLDHLQDKDPSYYYTDVLVPHRGRKTLQDFIDNNI